MKVNVRLVTPISLPATAQKHLRNLALAGMPEEVCGAIYTHNIIVQYKNTFTGDRRHGFDFKLSPSNDIKAIWHSHPTGPDKLSDDDIVCIRELIENGYNFRHILVTPKEIMEYEAVLL